MRSVPKARKRALAGQDRKKSNNAGEGRGTAMRAGCGVCNES